MTTTTPVPVGHNLLALGADGVLALVAALPGWKPGCDDDPNWLLEVSAAGLTADLRDCTEVRRRVGQTEMTPDTAVRVRCADIGAANQRLVRLDAVAHYLQHPDVLYDRDGWFGNDLPVLTPAVGGGYLVLDGTSRVAAARIRGDETIAVYLVR